jgi:rhamnogalacturonyl hydrolase YesR
MTRMLVVTTVAAAVLGANVASSPTTVPPLPTAAAVLATMRLADTHFVNVTHNGWNCDWTRSVYFMGAAAHARASGDQAVSTFVRDWAVSHNFTCPQTSAPVFPTNSSAYNEACGAVYTWLAGHDGNPERELALRAVFDREATGSGKDWDWVDALMALPSLASYTAATGSNAYATLATQFYSFNAGLLRSPTHGLFYRDAGWINRTSPNGQPVFWSRGNGWAAMGLAGAVGVLPPSNPARSFLAGELVSLLHVLGPLQGSDGFWRASLLDAPSLPGPETSGTAAFVYALAFAVNNGLVDAITYTPVVARGWTALADTALQPSGRLGYCQPPGNMPGPAPANSTTDYCVGFLLLAGEEVHRMVTAAV